MSEKVNTGGLKSFVYDKNKPTYSSKQEEEKYEKLGNRIYGSK